MPGASGYLLKNTGKEGLLGAVRSASKGESLLNPTLVQRVLEKMNAMTLNDEPGSEDEDALSDREKQVLGLTRRSEAARFATRSGLVGEDSYG